MSPESKSRTRRRLVERGLTLDLASHAKAFAFDDDDLRMVQQPIENGRGQGAVIVKHLGPLLKRPVGGEHDRALFVAHRDDLEEQISAGLVDGEIPELIEDE